MKGFENLKFEMHHGGGQIARMEFDNNFGVSVIFGKAFYSNGIDNYEVAITKDGHLTYLTHITDDVIGWQSKEQVSKIMKQVQEL